jgi:hypothetical protein
MYVTSLSNNALYRITTAGNPSMLDVSAVPEPPPLLLLAVVAASILRRRSRSLHPA